MFLFSASIQRAFSGLMYRSKRAIFARIPLNMADFLAHSVWQAGSTVSARWRVSGNIRAEIGEAVVGLAPDQARLARSGDLLESLIDRRLHFGRQLRGHETWRDLESIAERLARSIRQLRRDAPGNPVIVSPFHYVSQYANIYVIERLGALLGIRALVVVSGVPRDLYGNDHDLIPGVKVLYTYGDGNRNGLGLRFARSLRRDGVAVLFADVPPFALQRFPMETTGVSMFGRAARIHSGVIRIGAPLNASLLPFYLRFEKGRFDSHVFEPFRLAAPDAPERIASCIESALKDNYPRWIPAGHPSMYAFAPTR